MTTPDDALLQTVCAAVSPLGLNHAGVVSTDVYDDGAPPQLRTSALLPSARSIIVLASGGPALWSAFVDSLRADPRGLTDQAHPLDAFVRGARNRAAEALGHVEHRWFFVAADAEVHLDFRTLAVQAGLGAPSRLGLVIHPRWGPWIGLRAAVFVDAALDSTPPVRSVCEGCPAPCAEQCPGGAFPDGQWDVARCSDFHRTSDLCSQSCASRLACPVGEDARYPDLERLYHYDRRTGREALRRALGIADGEDPFVGVGPHWGDWQTAASSGEDDA